MAWANTSWLRGRRRPAGYASWASSASVTTSRACGSVASCRVRGRAEVLVVALHTRVWRKCALMPSGAAVPFARRRSPGCRGEMLRRRGSPGGRGGACGRRSFVGFVCLWRELRDRIAAASERRSDRWCGLPRRFAMSSGGGWSRRVAMSSVELHGQSGNAPADRSFGRRERGPAVGSFDHSRCRDSPRLMRGTSDDARLVRTSAARGRTM
jgi:hypothetical protein